MSKVRRQKHGSRKLELFIYSLNRYLLNTFYVPVTVLTERHETSLSSGSLFSSRRRERTSQIHAVEEKGLRSAGGRGDCSDKLLMRVGLLEKVTAEQRPEEGRGPLPPISGRRAIQTKGWRGVRWRERRGSELEEFDRMLRALKACMEVLILFWESWGTILSGMS